MSTGPLEGNISGAYCAVSGSNESSDVRLLFGRGLTLRRGGNSGTSKIGEDPRYILQPVVVDDVEEYKMEMSWC